MVNGWKGLKSLLGGGHKYKALNQQGMVHTHMFVFFQTVFATPKMIMIMILLERPMSRFSHSHTTETCKRWVFSDLNMPCGCVPKAKTHRRRQVLEKNSCWLAIEYCVWCLFWLSASVTGFRVQLQVFKKNYADKDLWCLNYITNNISTNCPFM